MRRRWLVLLSVITALVLVVIGIFIGAQFREPEYEPRFRLTEESDALKSNSKEVLEMKSNLMSSIAKNCRGNLKGPIPSSLEFDLSKTTDEGAKSLIKVFDVSLIEISSLKGYTYVLKETLPINKYTYHDEVQTGLLTNVPMEALLTYFWNDKLYERPVMVCPVISIDEKDFDCYLRNSDNEWATFDIINELDPTDQEFDKKITEFINNHYKKLSSPTETKTEEPQPEDSNNQDEQETKTEEPSQEPPKQEAEEFESLELDLSKKQGSTNELVEVSEINKLKIPGFKGYAHAFKKKLSISKYEYSGTEQEGLPTNTPLDAVLSYFREDSPYSNPFVVCTVTSARGRKFDCYLRDTVNNWSKNDEVSELNHRDPEFPQKLAKIVKDHYYPPGPSLEKYSWDQDASYDPYQSTNELPSEDESDGKSLDESSEYSDSDSEESNNQDEQDSGELNAEQLRHELEQKEEPQPEETQETKTEEPQPEDSNNQGEQESNDQEPQPEETQETKTEEPQPEDSNNQDEQETKTEEPQVPENLEINLANNTSNDEFINVSEVQDLEVPGYKGYSHIFNATAKVNSFKYNDKKQYGLPSNTDLDGLLVYFKNDKLDENPMAVCTIKSLEDMDFDCYLRDKDNDWSKNVQLSELDVTSEDFGIKAGRLVDQHYNTNN